MSRFKRSSQKGVFGMVPLPVLVLFIMLVLVLIWLVPKYLDTWFFYVPQDPQVESVEKIDAEEGAFSTATPIPTNVPSAHPEVLNPVPTPTTRAHGFINCENPLGVQGRYLGRHNEDSDFPGLMSNGRVSVDGPAPNLEAFSVFLNRSVGQYLGYADGCGHVFQFDINGIVKTWHLLYNIPQHLDPGDYVIADWWDPATNLFVEPTEFFVSDITGAIKYRMISPYYQEIGGPVQTASDCDPLDPGYVSQHEGYHLTAIYGGTSSWHTCSNGLIRVDYENHNSKYLNGWVYATEPPRGISEFIPYTCSIVSGQATYTCQIE